MANGKYGANGIEEVNSSEEGNSVDRLLAIF
jgi:hypothetical protein